MATKVQSFMSSQTIPVDFPITYLENAAILQVPVRLTVLEAVSFKQTCQNLIQADSPPEQILIDFQNTTFMDSSGLGSLVSNFKNARELGIKVTLRHVTPQVMAVLNLTGLDQVFPIESLHNLTVIETDKFTDPGKNNSRKVDSLPQTHNSVASWMKRAIDIVGALVGLVITFILFIPIAITIQIDDPGPILFKQTRCGWMGKRFAIWKFRSMCVDAEARKEYLANNYSSSLKLLCKLKNPIDQFFNDVMVNVEDESLKMNRLALLEKLYSAMNLVADLSKLSS
jgi:anti-anti-sigma factor